MRKDLKQPRSGETSQSVESRAAINKHPVHPMLVVYPTAFLSILPLTDLLYLWLEQPFWAQAGFWLAVGGLGMGLLAGLVGSFDMFTIRVVRRHISAWNHFIAAVMVLALAAANVWLRAPSPEEAVYPWGLLLSGTTFGMVAVAGWLGGTLSFKHGIGVAGVPAPEAQRDDAAPPAE